MKCRICGAPTRLRAKWRPLPGTTGLRGLLDRLAYRLVPICLPCLDAEVAREIEPEVDQ